MTQLQPEETRTEDEKKTSSLEVLVGKAARADSGALYELCEKIAKDVLFRATHIMGNRTDAEDVTQEVLIRVCAKIRSLRDPKTFRGWLGKIIANEANRHMTENARRGVVLNIDDYLEAVTEKKDDFLPQECAENGDYRKYVMQIIAKLPLRQREAIIFHYYDGLSITETAEAMSVTKPSVSRYLALAHEKIKREMDGQEFGTRKLGMLAAGPLLAGILRHEAESYVLPGNAWMQQTLAGCKEFIAANPLSAASGAQFSSLAGALAAIVAVAGVTAGVAIGGDTLRHMGGGVAQTEISIEGEVVFSGGVENGGNTVYINPVYAEVSADSTGGETRVLSWWVTEAGSDTVLYEGSGSEIGSTLSRMRESGADGKYMLYFRLEDEAGAIHRLGRSFYILPNT